MANNEARTASTFHPEQCAVSDLRPLSVRDRIAFSDHWRLALKHTLSLWSQLAVPEICSMTPNQAWSTRYQGNMMRLSQRFKQMGGVLWERTLTKHKHTPAYLHTSSRHQPDLTGRRAIGRQ